MYWVNISLLENLLQNNIKQALSFCELCLISNANNSEKIKQYIYD